MSPIAHPGAFSCYTEFMNKKIYLFDLFDTILTDLSLDFNSGLKILWKNHFEGICSYEEMEDYSKETLAELKRVQKDGTEFCFASREIEMYTKHFGTEFFELGIEEECNIQSAINTEEFKAQTKEVLETLKASGHRMYILSNSIFRTKVLENCLKENGADSYFDKVWSSADFGLRKPRKEFFDMAIGKIIDENPGYTIKDIVFVGNSYLYDAIGGTDAGLETVWLNVKGEENTGNLPVRIIGEIGELLE